MGSRPPLERMTRRDILNGIKSAGIVGMGGAGFPTHIKLSADENKIKHIIINACECEPGIYADYTLMLQKPGQILDGVNVILKLFPHAAAVIVTEDDKEDAAKLLKKYISENQSTYEKITVKILKTQYPQGAEKLLVYNITGRKLKYGELPANAGALVCNVATVYAIYKAIYEDAPLTERIVTVTGNAISAPVNMWVKIGTKISELIKEINVDPGSIEKIILGGPMMGNAVASPDIPITKTVSGVILIKKGTSKKQPQEAYCIRCGRCVDACPLKLIPCSIAELAQAHDIDRFTKMNGMTCMECGSCSYVCPAHRQLTQYIKVGKSQVAGKSNKKTGGGA